LSSQFEVGAIDLAVLIAYLILARVIALWVVRGAGASSDGFFLGGRTFVWPLIGFSLFATNMSGASFVGMAGAGYSSGIAVYSYEYMAAFILVVFIFFLLPFYIRTKVFTMPEFLERRFDRRSRYGFAALLIFLSIFLDCAGALYAGGLVVQTIYPAIPLWTGVAILAVLAAILSVFGGLGAVVVSDTIQAVVLIIGGIIIFFAAWAAIPSWDAVIDAAPADALSIVRPADDPFLPWPGLLGVFIIGVYFWTTNQLIVQRTLGAKTLDHGRWGAVFAGFLKLPPLFIMILPGVMAIPLYPDLRTPDLAFPTLAFDLLPIGVRGIILAALVAAITSTVDSILNSASTLVTMDFVRPIFPRTSDRMLVFIGRVTTVIVTIIGILWAPQIINFPSLWNYFQSILAYATPAIVAIFFVGVFWRGATADAAFYTFLVGLTLGVLGFVFIEIGGLIDLHFLYATVILFVLSLALMIGISRVTERSSSEEIDQMIWTPAVFHAESRDLAGKPLWQNYRYQSIVLVLVTVAIIIWWW